VIFALYAGMRALHFNTAPASTETALAELLARVADGQAQALGEVYDLHHEAVRAFAARLLGDAAIAEDLVHEVFVALPRAIRGFKGGSSLRSFLTGIAINHARHYVRGAVRRRAAVARLGAQPSAEGPETPERAAEQSLFLSALNRALDELPLEQRVAFVLCDVEERTSSEAAQITGAPEATMRTRLHHARKKLRSALEREGIR
jgi:RNA polymerase sigma-70 factor (ECF subfamily)